MIAELKPDDQDSVRHCGFLQEIHISEEEWMTKIPHLFWNFIIISLNVTMTLHIKLYNGMI
jgi:hypothetical protein